MAFNLSLFSIFHLQSLDQTFATYLLVRDVPLSSSPLSNYDWKTLSLFPSPYWFYRLPSRLPHLIDRDQHLRRKVAGKQLGAPSPNLAGTGLHTARDHSPCPTPVPGRQAQGRRRAWHHHFKSKGWANLKRLGTPGLKCISYHTEYPEIISPLHSPVTRYCGGGGKSSSYTHTRKKLSKEMTKYSSSYLCCVWLWSWCLFLIFTSLVSHVFS